MKNNNILKEIQETEFLKDLNGYNVEQVESFRKQILLILEKEMNLRVELESENENLINENKSIRSELDKIKFETKRAKALKK